MGVSAVGETGVRPATVKWLLLGGLLALALVVFLWGPLLTPGIHDAAKDKCNRMVGADFRSYRLDWKLPSSPEWDAPHWSCSDARKPDKAPVNIGWWVNPF